MGLLCKMLDGLTGCPGDALSTGVSPRVYLGLQLSGAAERMHGRSDSHLHQPRLNGEALWLHGMESHEAGCLLQDDG